MRIGLGITVCALLGCGGGTSVKEVNGPDGTPAVVIECKETGDCLEEAGEACPKGYEVLMTDREQRPNRGANAMEAWNASMQKRQAAQYTEDVKTLMIACR
ncbi:MAG: hypothetical protein R3B89_23605 [Polyangiaceae bacterium]